MCACVREPCAHLIGLPRDSCAELWPCDPLVDEREDRARDSSAFIPSMCVVKVGEAKRPAAPGARVDDDDWLWGEREGLGVSRAFDWR